MSSWTPPIHDRIVTLRANQFFSMSVEPGGQYDIKLLSGGPLYWSHSLKDHPSTTSYDDVLTTVNQVHTLNHPAWMVSPNDTTFDVIFPEPEMPGNAPVAEPSGPPEQGEPFYPE